MTNTWLARLRGCFSSGTMIFALITAFGAISSPLTASAQNSKKPVIIFDLVANPQFANCLRRSQTEEPRARATVVRGDLNDVLTLNLSGIKPGLQFDLFTVQRTSLLDASTPNPAFKGSFGLAWYQSDIHIGSNGLGQVRIKTILLDQIFGFDPDVALKPTNTFHLGFWFNNPKDAAACGFPANNPAKFTPFNGEHKAGPLAMISVPNPHTKLGPLCTDPDPSKPGGCNP